MCVTGDCNYNIRHVEITDMKNSFYGFLVINEPDSADSWGGASEGSIQEQQVKDLSRCLSQSSLPFIKWRQC